MTVEERLWQLVRRLKEKTAEDAVSWESTPYKASFQTSFPKFSVRISEMSGQPDYSVSIYDENGQLLEETDDVQISKAIKGLTKQDTSTMKDLYTMARRQALGVEAALDELLLSLDETGV